MAEPVTVARPYAEAVFKLAVEGNASGTLAAWSDAIANIDGVVADSRVQACISDPKISAQQLEALVIGGRKIEGQLGYARAVAGMIQGLGSRLDSIVARMSARARSEFKAPDLRKAIAVPRMSFESSMKSKLRRALED